MLLKDYRKVNLEVKRNNKITAARRYGGNTAKRVFGMETLGGLNKADPKKR